VHMTKQAKAAIEGEPTTSAGQGVASSDVIVNSPQPSPRREATMQNPLASSSADAPTSEPNKEMGEDHQEEERPEADPMVTSSLTNIPESSSTTRASTDELVRPEDVPASETAGSRAITTEIIGEENVSSQQDQIGNPFALECLLSTVVFFLLFFVFLNLTLNLNLIFSPPPFPSQIHDMEADINVEGIAKDAAKEANRIAVDEATNAANEESAKLAAAAADKAAEKEAAKVATEEAAKEATAGHWWYFNFRSTKF
jgi:hypothetical protein